MIKIKETKSVKMYYEDIIGTGLRLMVKDIDAKEYQIFIPMKSIFQVQRGLTSAIQRFYRKHDVRNTKKLPKVQ